MELNITKDILFEIIEHLKEAVYIVNAQGKVVYLNDAASQLEQMPKSDFLGKTIDAVYVNTEFHTHRNSPCSMSLPAVRSRRMKIWSGLPETGEPSMRSPTPIPL